MYNYLRQCQNTFNLSSLFKHFLSSWYISYISIFTRFYMCLYSYDIKKYRKGELAYGHVDFRKVYTHGAFIRTQEAQKLGSHENHLRGKSEMNTFTPHPASGCRSCSHQLPRANYVQLFPSPCLLASYQ